MVKVITISTVNINQSLGSIVIVTIAEKVSDFLVSIFVTKIIQKNPGQVRLPSLDFEYFKLGSRFGGRNDPRPCRPHDANPSKDQVYTITANFKIIDKDSKKLKWRYQSTSIFTSLKYLQVGNLHHNHLPAALELQVHPFLVFCQFI